MAAESSVIITGASTGIGRACALHMDALGWRVFAGVRTEADADSLREAATSRLLPLLLDVTNPIAIGEARRVVDRSVEGAGLSGLVNNAGVAYGGPTEYLDLKEMRQAFEVNFFGAIAVTQAFIPLLRRAGGRIVNMSSISGLVASPFLSPYSTSKWALEAWSDALRVELHPWSIGVSVIEPGAIETPIWTKGGEILDRLMTGIPEGGKALYEAALRSAAGDLKPHGLEAEEVAKAVANALTSSRPKTRYPIGAQGRLVAFFRHFPDRLRDAYFIRRLPDW